MNRKRRVVLGAVAVLGLLLLLLVRSDRSPMSAAPIAAETQSASSSGAQRMGDPPLAAGEGAPAPVIERITVEKTEVCRGEDNFVTVALAPGFDADPNLRIMMPGHDTAGRQMPFRLHFREGKQQPDMPEVVVFGKDGALATMKIPPVTVQDCTPGPSLAVAVSAVANTSATFALTAVVHNAGKSPVQPVRWHWDFGDGSEATTAVRTVEHSYDDRPQRTRISTFLVHVRAVDAAGLEILGRQSVELRNDAFDILQTKNAVLLMTQLTPRFPVLGADQRVTQRVRVHHAYDKPVTIDKVVVQRFRDNRETGTEEMQTVDVDPRQVLGTNVIPPGPGIEVAASLDTRAEPETKLLTFELHGTSADGIRAGGQYSVLPPPAPLPPEEREIVRDPALLADILATRAILGRDEVTHDDIMRLRREGALDGRPAVATGQSPSNVPGEELASRPPRPRRVTR